MIVHQTPLSAPAADQVISATAMGSAILALMKSKALLLGTGTDALTQLSKTRAVSLRAFLVSPSNEGVLSSWPLRELDRHQNPTLIF